MHPKIILLQLLTFQFTDLFFRGILIRYRMLCIYVEELLRFHLPVQNLLHHIPAGPSPEGCHIIGSQHFRILTLQSVKKEQFKTPLFIHIVAVVGFQEGLQFIRFRTLGLLYHIVDILQLLRSPPGVIPVLLHILFSQLEVSLFQIKCDKGEQDPVGSRSHGVRFYIHVPRIGSSSHIFINLSADPEKLGIQRLFKVLGIQDLHSQAVFLCFSQLFYFIYTCHAESGAQNDSPL